MYFIDNENHSYIFLAISKVAIIFKTEIKIYIYDVYSNRPVFIMRIVASF